MRFDRSAGTNEIKRLTNLSSSFFDQSVDQSSFLAYALAITCFNSADAASLLLGVMAARHLDTHSLTQR